MNVRSLKDTPAEYWPYEKCIVNGPEMLTDTELLAVLIRTGTKSRDVLQVADDLLHQDNEDGLIGLQDLSITELRERYGIGKVKAVQLSCVFEISKRIWRSRSRKRIACHNAASIADFYKEDIRYKDVEQVHIMLFDVRMHFLRSVLISQGTIDHSVVSPREIFRELVKYKAASFVLIHNHPSGDVTPSPEDIRFTSLLLKNSIMMNIRLTDSVIIGDGGYFSFFENDMLEAEWTTES